MVGASARDVGFLLVLSGPAGAGKTTLAQRLCSKVEDCVLSVSATTRPPRAHEHDGEDYFFLDRDDFLARAERGDFAEYAEFCGHLYGTPKQLLDEHTAAGRHVVLDIEVQGAGQLHRAYPDAVMIFVLPPAPEILVGRLIGRGTESRAQMAQRMDTARREVQHLARYDYWIVNDDLDRAFDALLSILQAEHHRVRGGELDDWLGGRSPADVLCVEESDAE